MKKNRLFEDDWKQCNDEAKVAKMQLKNMQANVQELLNKIDACEELDAWVQSYLTKADDYLDSVKKYVVFGQDEETTIIEPIPITGDMGEPKTAEEPAPLIPGDKAPEPLMPPIDGYDPDAEDLSPEPEEAEIEEEPGEEEEIEELPGEDVEDVEDMEDMEDEEDVEDMGDEEEMEDLPDMDDDNFQMPSINNFEIGGGEAVSGEEEIPMPKPEEEDELSFDDLDFFNTQEYANPEEEEKMSGEFDEMESDEEEAEEEKE